MQRCYRPEESVSCSYRRSAHRATPSNKTPMRNDKHLSIGSGPGSHPLKPLALIMRGSVPSDMAIAAHPPPCEYMMISLVAEFRLTSISVETSDVDPSSFCKTLVATMSWIKCETMHSQNSCSIPFNMWKVGNMSG
jgi:hypothetical protein